MIDTSPVTTKQYLLDEIARLTEELKPRAALRLPVDEPMDEHDMSVRILEQSRLEAVVEQRQRLLQQMHVAYGRLAAGTYGVCEDCDQPIPAERLEAIPWATLCVSCQSRREQGNGRRWR